MLPIITVLAENTLLKTAFHFLLLLVGFDTLTYRKDYDRSPTLVGHHFGSNPIWTALAKVEPALFNPKGIRKKQYVPNEVMNVVFSSSSLVMKI